MVNGGFTLSGWSVVGGLLSRCIGTVRSEAVARVRTVYEQLADSENDSVRASQPDRNQQLIFQQSLEQ